MKSTCATREVLHSSVDICCDVYDAFIKTVPLEDKDLLVTFAYFLGQELIDEGILNKNPVSLDDFTKILLQVIAINSILPRNSRSMLGE